MTPHKDLCQTALTVLRLLEKLPMHEKGTVLSIATNLLQSQARSLELAQLETNMLRNAAPAVTDEHYRAQ